MQTEACSHCPIDYLCDKDVEPSEIHIMFLLEVVRRHHDKLETHLQDEACKLYPLYVVFILEQFLQIFQEK